MSSITHPIRAGGKGSGQEIPAWANPAPPVVSGGSPPREVDW
ncbi:hypothetical protein [Amycolatopsis nigrescens]|nr:hypothetical protein [Amycolatopsis nigrescens]